MRSIRTKLVILTALVALLVGGVSAAFNFWTNRSRIRAELDKRGMYIVDNLAYSAKYGVITEDRAQLSQFLEGVLHAEAQGDREKKDAKGRTAAESDIVSAMVRDAKGATLVQRGAAIADLPKTLPDSNTMIDALTTDGDAVALFRAPVMVAETGGGGMAAELGLSPGTGGGQEIRRGGVEVAISKRTIDRELTGSIAQTVVLSLLLAAVGALLGSSVLRHWLDPLLVMAEVSAAVAKGDLTRDVPVTSEDEIGAVAGSLGEMIRNLRHMVDQSQEASVQVASSASEISANAKLIIRGAQAQAQAAEETSTSMEEMAAAIQTVATGAQGVANYVEETSSSINEMGASIEEVARSSGTLAHTVTEASATVEEMTVSIEQLAHQVEDLSETVTTTSAAVDEITEYVASVARSAETLSESARRTSINVSDMAGAVKDVAELAIEADQMSTQASQDARTGGEAVSRTIQGMKTIADTMENTARVITGLGRRSQEIGRILEVIEEIADQTNLLALNAAIEAARAGDAGRGFAVVADEVRKLAERSVEATKEIGEVVRQVQAETGDAVEAAKAGATETKEGILLADKAGLALRSIIDSVTRSSQLMAEIASSTAKQSQASADTLTTVANMNASTDEVARAVKEQAERSRQIRSAIENIKRVIGQAAYAMKEQATGGRQVRLAVENMNKIANQVGIATREQAEGSRQIVAAVEKMNDMTQQVSQATAEQKKGGELVLQAMENISETSRDNLATLEEMSKATANLAQQADNLAKLISVFRVQ